MDSQWDFVFAHYNDIYSKRFDCPQCLGLALKLKFHDLYHGTPSEGSSWMKYESYVKKIEDIINAKAGIIINNVDHDEYQSNNGSIKKDEKKAEGKCEDYETKKKPVKKKSKT